MRKKMAAVLILILIPLLFSGCYDSVEINDYAYVTLMGIDKGVSDKLRLTFQVPQFTEVSGGAGGGGFDAKGEEKEDKENFSIDTPSLLSGIAAVNANIPKLLNFLHLKAIVVSEELAQSGYMAEFLVPLTRYRQIRRSTNIIICKGSAQEFVKAAKPYLGAIVTETLEELIERYKYTGFYPELNLGLLADQMKSSYTQALGIYGALNTGENFKDEGPEYGGGYKIPGDYFAGDTPRNGGQEIELLGTAVFDGGKMVGKLTGFESQMVSLIWGHLKRTVFTIPDPKSPEHIIPIEIKEFESPKVKVDTKSEKPHIEVKLSVEGDMTAIQSGENYEHDDDIIEEAFEQYLKENIQKTFIKGQALKVDIFRFGERAVRNFLTIPEWEEYNWLEKVNEATLNVEVDFTIRRTGRQHESRPIRSSEGVE